MALTITNTSLSGTIDASELDQNFTDVVNKFSGNIVNADISSTAGIATSKLAADKAEWIVELRFVMGGATTYSAIADNTIVDAVPVPGASGDTAWTIADAAYATNRTGTSGNPTFNLLYGYWDASSNFQTTLTILDEQAITATTGEAGQASITPTGTSINFPDSQQRVIALAKGSTNGTAACDTEGDFIRVSLRLTRSLQAS